MTNQSPVKIDSKSTTVTGDDARHIIAEGLHEAAKLVGSTMGPEGRLVILADKEVPMATKDGHSVLNALQLDNPWHQFAVKLLVDATKHSVAVSGDGTTTTTVLTYAMVEWGLEQLAKGVKLKDVVSTLKDDVTALVSNIEKGKSVVKTQEDLYNVAYISTNGDDEMASMVSEAWWKVGVQGMVDYKPGIENHDVLSTYQGYRIDRGFYESAFKPASGIVEESKVDVVLCAKEVNGEMLAALCKTFPQNDVGVIVAPEFDNAVIGALLRNQLPIIPVKAQGAGAMQQAFLTDLGVYLGTEVVKSVDQITEKFVTGFADSCVVESNSTVFIAGQANRFSVESHVATLTTQMNEAVDAYDKEAFRTRIAKLTGGVAVIYVAGNTDAEMEERKHRYDDAIRATHSAYKDGYSLGGGYNYLLCDNIPWSKAPLIQLCVNADLAFEEIYSKFASEQMCYNMATNEYCSAIEFAPIDAAMTQITALKTALSIALVTLRTNGVLTTQNTLVPYTRRVPM